MGLQLSDRWLWDFWLARAGPDYHLFFLQAPRALGDPERRHWHVSVGHAVSQDLRTWELLPDALHPSREEDSTFDSYTTWTGSVFHHAGLWYLFYTGGRRDEEGRIQRVGLATSVDLLQWKKHPANPLIVADPAWYELLDLEHWHDQAWRDPYIIRHPTEKAFYAFITARVNYGPADERGVIGLARSENLIDWTVLPPVTRPGEFGHLEVPQWVPLAGRYYLLFCAGGDVVSARRRARSERAPVTGTYAMSASRPLGPFAVTEAQLLVGDEVGAYYAGKLVEGPGGRWVFLAARLHGPEGEFVGALSDPFPVTVNAAGVLTVEKSREVNHSDL